MSRSGSASGPTVSVVMATRNGERFLSEQLESIARQSHPIDELVVYDDASNDRTVEMVRAFAEGAPFAVRLERGDPQAGATVSFSRAFAASQGEIVFWADQDDVWLPAKVAALLAIFGRDRRIGLACSASRLIGESGEDLGETYWERDWMSTRERARVRRGDAFCALLARAGIPAHAMAFRREVVPDLLPIPPEWPHDGWTTLLASARSAVAILETPLTLHRLHGAQSAGLARQTLVGKTRSAGRHDLETIELDLRRVKVLGERLAKGKERDPVAPEVAVALAERRSFLESRSHMRRAPAGRGLQLVARELLKGRYGRVGRGWLAVARDLVVVMRTRASDTKRSEGGTPPPRWG